jgi:hypothetical protein
MYVSNMKLLKVFYDLYIYRKGQKEPDRIIELDMPQDRIESVIPRWREECMYYDGMKLTHDEILALKAAMDEPIVVDLENHDYYIVDAAEYEWNNSK